MIPMDEAKRIEKYILELRRHFHAFPELSWQEFNTCQRICKELDGMGIPNTTICDTGVVGIIRGKCAKPVIAIRADIDALPVSELTELECKSRTEGVMHACGHDSHITMLLGAAKILKDYAGELNCTVKLIFQPAEEFITDSGAGHVMECEELEDIDNIVAAHIWSYLPTGTVSVEAGPRMASADSFEIDISGKGGHGAMPDQTVDPILVMGALIGALQSIVSREVVPTQPAVVSVCSAHSGNSANVIPDTATIMGTVRTFDNSVRDKMPEAIERIAKQVCAAYRADCSVRYKYGPPPTINDPVASAVAERAVVAALGENALVTYPASMTGEDFAKMLLKIPGCLAFVGCRNEEQNQIYPLHSPKFNLDEKAMLSGIAFFVQYVFEAQEQYKKS